MRKINYYACDNCGLCHHRVPGKARFEIVAGKQVTQWKCSCGQEINMESVFVDEEEAINIIADVRLSIAEFLNDNLNRKAA